MSASVQLLEDRLIESSTVASIPATAQVEKVPVTPVDPAVAPVLEKIRPSARHIITKYHQKLIDNGLLSEEILCDTSREALYAMGFTVGAASILKGAFPDPVPESVWGSVMAWLVPAQGPPEVWERIRNKGKSKKDK